MNDCRISEPTIGINGCLRCSATQVLNADPIRRPEPLDATRATCCNDDEDDGGDENDDGASDQTRVTAYRKATPHIRLALDLILHHTHSEL
jgi:hypothetical protein